MSHLFLLNEAVESVDFDAFKEGVQELNAIEKEIEHRFYKHESVYQTGNYSMLFSSFSSFGPVEQLVVKFIEQLKPCEENIDTEAKANSYCGADFNGFLGINFAGTPISELKKIVNNDSYIAWCLYFAPKIDKLRSVLENCEISPQFLRSWDDATSEVQQSIIDQFQKAKDRNLFTPFYPDTKIVKDVTPQRGKAKVMELRVYTPVAVRVYFNETDGMTKIASLGGKSAGNQTTDINSAAKILTEM